MLSSRKMAALRVTCLGFVPVYGNLKAAQYSWMEKICVSCVPIFE